MGLFEFSSVFFWAVMIFFLLVMLRLFLSCWVFPGLAYLKLKRSGFTGPTPRFPLGNISEMMKKNEIISKDSSQSLDVSNDIHSTVFPYFARWQQSHGMHQIYHILLYMRAESCTKP